MPFFDLSGSDSISTPDSCRIESMSISNAEQEIHGVDWADASIGSSLMDMASDPTAHDTGGASSLTPPTAKSPGQAPMPAENSEQPQPGMYSQSAVSTAMPTSGLTDGDKCDTLPPPEADLPEKEEISELYPYIKGSLDSPADPPADPPAAQALTSAPSPQKVIEEPLPLVDHATKPSSSAYNKMRAPDPNPGVPLRITTTSRVPIPTRPLALAHGENNLSANSSHARPKQSLSKPRPTFQKLLTKTSQNKPASVVEDVTQVVLPAGFFNASKTTEDASAKNSQVGGEGKTQDAISRLAELLIKAGGEDKAGILKHTPSKNSAWKNRVKKIPKWPPTYPPPDESDSSLSTSSSVASVPDPPDRKAIRRQQRKDLANWTPKSLAKEVYGDSRYFGSTAQKGKLVIHEGWEEMGPLEMTKFRDYRLYPVDYHVTEILGLNSRKANRAKVEEAAESSSDEESEESVQEVTSRGRKRKRVRRLAEEQRLTTPRKRGVGRPKKEAPAAGRTRVGDKYQASVAARPFSDFRESDSSYVPE